MSPVQLQRRRRAERRGEIRFVTTDKLQALWKKIKGRLNSNRATLCHKYNVTHDVSIPRNVPRQIYIDCIKRNVAKMRQIDLFNDRRYKLSNDVLKPETAWVRTKETRTGREKLMP